MNIRLSGASVFGGLMGLAGVCYGLYQSWKAGETSKKIDMTIQEVSEKANMDIEKAMVDKAIERAVEREVRTAITDVSRRVRDDIKSEITKEVKREVEQQYKAISEEVTKKISDEVASIDEESFRAKVQRNAERAIEKKVEDTIAEAKAAYLNKINEEAKFMKGTGDLVRNVVTGALDNLGSGYRYR